MLYYSLFGAFSFIYINISFTVIIFFTIVTKSVSEQLYLSHQQSQILPTILTFLIISSIAIGLTFMILARLNLGNLFRYIPYPVAGGYSIGLGWFVIDLISKNSFSTPIHLNGIFKLFTNGELYYFLFTIMFGIALYLIQIKFKKPILF
jgi:SulP family sulfate permease